MSCVSAIFCFQIRDVDRYALNEIQYKKIRLTFKVLCNRNPRSSCNCVETFLISYDKSFYHVTPAFQRKNQLKQEPVTYQDSHLSRAPREALHTFPSPLNHHVALARVDADSVDWAVDAEEPLLTVLSQSLSIIASLTAAFGCELEEEEELLDGVCVVDMSLVSVALPGLRAARVAVVRSVESIVVVVIRQLSVGLTQVEFS